MLLIIYIIIFGFHLYYTFKLESDLKTKFIVFLILEFIIYIITVLGFNLIYYLM